MKKKHIAVLMGGFNSEREVSLSTGEGIYKTLIELGYPTSKIDFDRDVVAKLQEIKPDIVFNALHGKYGEDGCIQGLLDILNIPYTHSGITASAICMNKILTHKICAAAGVKIPQSEILHKNATEKNHEIINRLGRPFVIKPNDEGSSVGVEVILDDSEFDIDNYAWKYGDEMIIERYIAGQEIQVAVVNNKALGAIEVRPKNLFYDYQCKYTPGMTEYIMPAAIPQDKYQEVLDLALRCHRAAGCTGITRIDFIFNNKDVGKFKADQQFYLLEINTHPGMTPTSLVPKIAKYNGMSFHDLIEYAVNAARCGGSA